MSKEIAILIVCGMLLLYFAYKIGRSAGKDAAQKSAMFQPPESYWQELATLIVWKCARNGVSITDKDMNRYQKEFNKAGAILITGGKPNRLTFKIVTRERARELNPHADKD